MVSKMFGAMMPRGSKKLALSKMNMGAKMIRSVMKKQNVDSLEDLIQQGVKLMACQIMGITQEELLDSVEVGGEVVLQAYLMIMTILI